MFGVPRDALKLDEAEGQMVGSPDIVVRFRYQREPYFAISSISLEARMSVGAQRPTKIPRF